MFRSNQKTKIPNTKMKSSILREAINSLLAKKPSTGQELEGSSSGVTFYSPWSSSPNSTANSTDISRVGSTKSSRRSSTIPEEAQSSTSKGKSRYMFHTTNLVEHRIVQPGSHCLPFPWTHNTESPNTTEH